MRVVNWRLAQAAPSCLEKKVRAKAEALLKCTLVFLSSCWVPVKWAFTTAHCPSCSTEVGTMTTLLISRFWKWKLSAGTYHIYGLNEECRLVKKKCIEEAGRVFWQLTLLSMCGCAKILFHLSLFAHTECTFIFPQKILVCLYVDKLQCFSQCPLYLCFWLYGCCSHLRYATKELLLCYIASGCWTVSHLCVHGLHALFMFACVWKRLVINETLFIRSYFLFSSSVMRYICICAKFCWIAFFFIPCSWIY